MEASLRQCAILMGGLGTRLGTLTQSTPKPLLDVGGRPFLAWIMRAALAWGVEEFVFLTGHLRNRVEAQVGTLTAALSRKVDVKISAEPVKAGTGGALYYARGLLERRFLLLNGDSLFQADLGPALEKFAFDDGNAACRMILRSVPEANRYGLVSLEGDRVTAFMERPAKSGPGLINSGIYLMDRCIAERAVPYCSLERDLLPEFIAEGAVRGTVASGWFVDIGILADLDRARTELSNQW